MKHFLIFAVVSLAACTSESNSGPVKPVENSSPEVATPVIEGSSSTAKYSDTGKQIAWNEAGKDALKGKLKDPDSAKFRNVNFYSGSGTPVTCGEVNAKNSFGGYGGFERFIAAGNVLTVMESEMVDGDLQKVWDQFCK
jgi:hypothetical protein